MKSEAILARLREHESTLRARGVQHVALFGSRARGQAQSDSDTDILIVIDPAAPIGVWEYAALKNDIAAWFDGPTDVVSSGSLHPNIRPNALAEAIYAF